MALLIIPSHLESSVSLPFVVCSNVPAQPFYMNDKSLFFKYENVLDKFGIFKAHTLRQKYAAFKDAVCKFVGIC